MTPRSARTSWYLGLGTFLSLLLAPSALFAQSGIAGVVRDASGGVLPGVAVEASSPALIEKVRVAISDGEGLYNIVDLRPGTYVVTFSLPGFASVRRDGIELPAAFTATINVEMRVGSVEETITVSGAAPVVDIQAVTKQAVFSKDLVDFLPTARTPQSFAPLVPGVVGGLNVSGVESRSLSIHGTRPGEANTAVDGFSDVQARGAGGGNSTFYMNPLNIQEMNVELGGNSAERDSAGIFTNVIPREGSNTFRGGAYFGFSNEALETNNLTAEHMERGLTAVNGLKETWDGSGALGGRILRDRLWFFGSWRESVLTRYIAGLYYNKDPKGWAYVPDLDRPALVEISDDSRHLRLTWQASARNKFSVSYEIQPHVVFQRAYSSLRSPETTAYTPYIPNYFAQVVWKSPVSSRVLIEAGAATVINDYNGRRQNELGGVTVDFETLSKTEQSTGLVFGSTPASGDAYGHHINRSVTSKASVSYVTGSHALKTGISLRQGVVIDSADKNGALAVTLLNGAPRSLTLQATPWEQENRIKADFGLFVQDRWTYERLTLNLGVRYDYYNGLAEAIELPPARFVPARSFPEVNDIPNWKDLSPRFGASYDLFGSGRTALKVGLAKFVAGLGASGITQLNNPVNTSVVTANRNWNDVNRNFEPDCDLNNPATNGECGPISNLNFGKANPNATRYTDDVLRGWSKREYNWEASAEIQHELRRGLALSLGYFRRSFGNFTVTDNVLITPTDFDPFCVIAPVDPLLPGGGGNQVCGFYDVSVAKFGQTENEVSSSEKFGSRSEIYNGVDVSANARLPEGVLVSGGVSLGRTALNSCFVVDSPQDLLFCDVRPPFQANVKGYLVYPLPWWGLQTSAAFQSVPGPVITATRTYTNTEIRPALGRDLSSGPNGTLSLNIIQPGTMYSDRVNQLDFRIAKSLLIGRNRVLGSLDIFNLFNSSDTQLHNTTYGPAWLRPTQVLNGRNLKFNVQVDF